MEAYFDLTKRGSKTRLKMFIQKISLKTKKWIFISDKKPRSLNQNNYYFGVIVKILSEELGITPNRIHNILGQEFLLTETVLPNNKVITEPRSTADLNTAEAEAYYENCRIWAQTELNIYIPMPNE